MIRYQVAPVMSPAATPGPAPTEVPVLSVNGRTGKVIVTAGDVGVDPGEVAQAVAGMVAGDMGPSITAAHDQATAAAAAAGLAASTASNAQAMAVGHRNRVDNPHKVTPEQLGLHAVATSGAYTDLTGRPTIPSKPSDIGAQPAGSYQPAGNYQPVGNYQPAGDYQPAGNYATTTALTSLTAQVTALTATVTAVSGRAVRLARGRVAVPLIASGATVEVMVTWPTLPATPTSTVVFTEPAGALLGQVTAAVKADPVTPSGCTLQLAAPVLVTLGAGHIVVVAVCWA